MRQLRKTFRELKEEYTKLTWFAIAVLIVSVVPDWQGRLEYWSAAIRWALPHLASGWGRTALMIFGLALIWLDHRRVLARHGKAHPRSLEGRCLKVRDGMQTFLDSLGEQQKGFLDGETETQYIVRAATERGRRWNLLGHYYELNCAAEVSRLFHEFGLRGVQEDNLETDNHRKKEEEYKIIIEALARLSRTPDAKNII